jgi:hypothetical protein
MVTGVAVVSIVNWRVALVLALPAWSTARTPKVCGPSTVAGRVYGDAHAAKVPPSRAHASPVAPLTSPAACISETSSWGLCQNGLALNSPYDIAVSADGKNAYVASGDSDAVAVFARDASTGALTQLGGTNGCVSEDGTGWLCATGHGLGLPYGVTVSPDGKSVYVASLNLGAVAVFSRDLTTGALTQLPGTAGCFSNTGSDGCARGRGLGGASHTVVSPDGKNVYVSADGGTPAVAAFSRDTSTGALTQLTGTVGCVSETGNSGDCSDDHALDGATRAVISSDGQFDYVISHSGDDCPARREGHPDRHHPPADPQPLAHAHPRPALPPTDRCQRRRSSSGRLDGPFGLAPTQPTSHTAGSSHQAGNRDMSVAPPRPALATAA